MTRSVLLAALALSTSLIPAQAASPAHIAIPNVVLARAVSPAVYSAAADAALGPIRVSTGVVAPKLIKSAGVPAINGISETFIPGSATVVVNLTVDAKGKPTNISIEQGYGPVVDQEVLKAVGNFRFEPGTLDGQPFALPVRLQVVIQHDAK
jgi:TonB family protein